MLEQFLQSFIKLYSQIYIIRKAAKCLQKSFVKFVVHKSSRDRVCCVCVCLYVHENEHKVGFYTYSIHIYGAHISI